MLPAPRSLRALRQRDGWEDCPVATVASLINMKGGVGKSTLTFNLAWSLAWRHDRRVLAVDLDPQANLSQYFLGAGEYLQLLADPDQKTVVDVFEQYSAPSARVGSPTRLTPSDAIHELRNWSDGSLLHFVPSRLELAWTLKNPTEKSELLPAFIAQVESEYDVVLIDCAPTESILTTAAYRSSRYVFVPVRPEFLATIGLPLLARSLDEFRLVHQNHRLDMGGIIFNGLRRVNTPPAQQTSRQDVIRVAAQHQWPVFDNVAHHSDSYATGSRSGAPIFLTDYAREYVIREFELVADEFLRAIS